MGGAGGVCSLSAAECSTSCPGCSVVLWIILTRRSRACCGLAPVPSSSTTSASIT